ncbi:MAG: bifunctional methylenetetrahydrofolate dehydrogenase/methenyltetrahydrofolate cyclohydrolase FolD [Bdellovibrionales bacterium]|nr:bifunctional methylenetetrahydrofolate dehydrogenase/methenyltetrahydrofolate cyclohydrolase FolD [Bdellovibrionales bacterium]
MSLLDGKALSKKILASLALQVENFKNQYGRVPGLTVILVGEDPASAVYVRSKHKSCEKIGMKSEVLRFSDQITEDQLIEKIASLNQDAKVDGILVQLPLPEHIDTESVLAQVRYEKDVDGFHPFNSGRLLRGQDAMVPCTPLGVMELLAAHQIAVDGKDAVVIGKSNIVGKPMAALLMNAGATVSVCHSKTKDLATYCRHADLIVSAAGRPNLLTEDMVKDGAVVIDVGINRLDSGILVGDVQFDEVSKKCSWITPVPGGVGPMTIAMLLKNTLKAAQQFESLPKP